MDQETRPTPLPAEGRAPSLTGATDWLNSRPLDIADLRGRVVLVDFCTYTCINWIRTLPYVRAWEAKYRDDGLVVIGAHTPEFSFEGDLENVRRALGEMDVRFPIAVDSRYAIWEAFANQYWPALYFIDAQGRIRHHRFGEGDYERSELAIQQLLEEAGAHDLDRDLIDPHPEGAEAPADWDDLESPDEYLGSRRTENFEGLDPRPDGLGTERLRTNRWQLFGDWTVEAEGVVLNEPTGRIAYEFRARDLHLVMGPVAGDAEIRFRVLLDGEPPGEAHGADIDREGYGIAGYRRMFQLIRQRGPIVDRRFEVEFLDRGAGAYVFTFG